MIEQLHHEQKDTKPRKKFDKVSFIPEDVHEKQLKYWQKIWTTKIIIKLMALKDTLTVKDPTTNY